MADDESRLDRAIDELYAGDLDQFVARRTELAREARSDGDKDAAKAITGLRKPTQSAFTINRLARTDPSSISALVDVGGELRQAQRSADAKQLRELNTQRRKLLDTLTTRAFQIIGQQSPTAGQREEVTATLTAALADAAVADQLRQGILVRAAESSGFGFSAPELTLIRSPVESPAAGADANAAPSTPAAVDAEPDPEPVPVPVPAKKVDNSAADRKARAAAERDRQRAARAAAVEQAQAEVDAADAAVHDAVTTIDTARQLIRLLQRQLTEAKTALEDSQQQAKVAEVRQRKARAALNKASG